MHICIYRYVDTEVCVYIYIHSYVHVCIYMYMYIHVCGTLSSTIQGLSRMLWTCQSCKITDLAGVVTCFVDIVTDVRCPIPFLEVKAALQAKALGESPAPYGLACNVEYGIKISIATLRQESGNIASFKIVNLTARVQVALVREFPAGKLHMVEWKGEVGAMRKCIHVSFGRLACFQCHKHVFLSVAEGKMECHVTAATKNGMRAKGNGPLDRSQSAISFHHNPDQQ